jgi:hypothetical protein
MMEDSIKIPLSFLPDYFQVFTIADLKFYKAIKFQKDCKICSKIKKKNPDFDNSKCIHCEKSIISIGSYSTKLSKQS